MVSRSWAVEFEFRSYTETSDPPAIDAADCFTDFGKIIILIFLKATELIRWNCQLESCKDVAKSAGNENVNRQ